MNWSWKPINSLRKDAPLEQCSPNIAELLCNLLVSNSTRTRTRNVCRSGIRINLHRPRTILFIVIPYFVCITASWVNRCGFFPAHSQQEIFHLLQSALGDFLREQLPFSFNLFFIAFTAAAVSSRAHGHERESVVCENRFFRCHVAVTALTITENHCGAFQVSSFSLHELNLNESERNELKILELSRVIIICFLFALARNAHSNGWHRIEEDFQWIMHCSASRAGSFST